MTIMRRHFLAISISTVLMASPALAETYQEKFVAQLQQQGFRNIVITRTWLGRTRITASSKSAERELIFNSRSGEILRDYSEAKGGDVSESTLIDTNTNSGSSTDSSNSGSGGNSGNGGDSGGSGGDSGDSGGSGGDSGDSGGSGGGGHASIELEDFNYLTGGNSLEIKFYAVV